MASRRACNRQPQRPLTRADIILRNAFQKNLDDDVGTAGTARPTVQLKPTRRRLFDKENFTTSTPKRGKKVNYCYCYFYGRTLSDASMLCFANVFIYLSFMRHLCSGTAERIFMKLSLVVDLRCI